MSSSAVQQVSRGDSRKFTHLPAEGELFTPGERVLERYVVQALLGEGATGFSYHVYDDSLKADVCLKVIHAHLLQTAEERRHFDIVLRQVGQLLHASLSRVFDVGEVKGQVFFTQQFAEGMPLRRIIDERLLKGNLFSCKELEPILVQLVHALEAVHQKSAHLNLKPGNVFVLPDLLKLTDVGLGLAIPRAPFVQAHRTRREESYFAPEFLAGMEANTNADVYSLGVMMGEMLAGVLPENGGVPSLSKNNPEIPEELETIYRKAVAANPLVRYRSMADFSLAFCAFYEKHPQKSEKKVSLGKQTPLQAGGDFPAEEAVEDGLTPRVPSGDLSQVELKDLLPKRAVRTFQWVAILLGALGVAGILVALMSSDSEELTGRNVEGFAQTAPVAPVAQEAQKNEAASEPPRVFHTEEAMEPSKASGFSPPSGSSGAVPSYFTEELRDEPPPESSRTPPRAGVPPGAEVSRCPERMARIPAGSFRMGTVSEDPYLSFEDLPAVSKEVGGFCIDIYEYPNRHGQLPTVDVSWAKAQELCQKQNKRLCTEVEWEKACRGSNGLRWPYGNVFQDGVCNSANATGAARVLATSGRFSRCISAYAVFDMSGNVAEWTTEKVAKGGSFASTDVGVRCATRNPRAGVASTTGFRCCANLK